jgi:hypothetical protein
MDNRDADARPEPSVDHSVFPLDGARQCPSWCSRDHLDTPVIHPEDGFFHESPPIETVTTSKPDVSFALSCQQWVAQLDAEPEPAMIGVMINGDSDLGPRLTVAEARNLSAALQIMATVAESTSPRQKVGPRFVTSPPTRWPVQE